MFKSFTRFGRLSRTNQAIVAVSLMAGTGAASAAEVDVSAVVAALTSGIATVTSIGIAALSLVVVIKLFKYVKTAL